MADLAASWFRVSKLLEEFRVWPLPRFLGTVSSLLRCKGTERIGRCRLAQRQEFKFLEDQSARSSEHQDVLFPVLGGKYIVIKMLDVTMKIDKIHVMRNPSACRKWSGTPLSGHQ